MSLRTIKLNALTHHLHEFSRKHFKQEAKCLLLCKALSFLDKKICSRIYLCLYFIYTHGEEQNILGRSLSARQACIFKGDVWKWWYLVIWEPKESVVVVLVTKLCPIFSIPCTVVSSVHWIFQARILEWVAIPFSRGIFLSQGLSLCLIHCSLCIAGRSFTD